MTAPVETDDAEASMIDLTKPFDFNFRLFNVDSESRQLHNPPPPPQPQRPQPKTHEKKRGHASYELLETSLVTYWKPFGQRRGVCLGPEETYLCTGCEICAPSEYVTNSQPECNRIPPTAVAMPLPEMPSYERVNYELALFKANMEELRQHRAFASELTHQDPQQIDQVLEGKTPEKREISQRQLKSDGAAAVPWLTDQVFPLRSSDMAIRDKSINVAPGDNTIHVATGKANGSPPKAATARVPKKPRVAKANGSDPPKKRGRPRKYPLPEPKPPPESKLPQSTPSQSTLSQPTPDSHGKA
ncbi:uncharacterized protein FIESC28_02055 [Fusarium coffeatum]|uniref:Uncharacterized protein n=1 Tax=Fusarium coffeatum TaxID=231269 RepID=A0A366S738_9HYPO|nr:uncharacterized protein FIESC28_02055 [Fusarium coffeatum]RBR25147.1 hypothetical protein FIESC28_02055 [Fusarium coffeatum]